jgi:dTDP-4-dehydrorhamnose reductase
MPSVIVLGSRGMLGSMLADTLAGSFDVTPVDRARFVAGRDDPGRLIDEVGAGWVINAIGKIKPTIDENDPESVERALEINTRFPRALADAAGARGVRVIHATTDCVYSGAGGDYAEDAPHDPVDLYGSSKAGGEVQAPHVVNLRASIIGPELGEGRSLVAWLLAQPEGAQLTGFTNHLWNGITTYHHARLSAGIIGEGLDVAGSPHVIPGDTVTKARLLELLAEAFGRTDLQIAHKPAGTAVDRSLSTLDPERNARLWRAAGYPAPPTVAEMIQELAASPLCARSLSSSGSART